MIIDMLVDMWEKVELEKNSILLLHSDIKRTLFKCFRAGIHATPNDIIDSLLLTLGNEGTLLLPTFNYDFCCGTSFDIRNTPSQVGTLSEVARQRPDAVRTGHPIFSFVALGSQKEIFANLDNYSAFGDGSPFDILFKMNGSIGVLDHIIANTFYHYIETKNQNYIPDYRYSKVFKGEYIDWLGASQEKEYEFHVRTLEPEHIPLVLPVEKMLWDAGLYKGHKTGEDSGLRIINAREMCSFITNEIIIPGKAEGLLYYIEGREYDKNGRPIE